mgnify:CR=1 FL=1
MSAVIHRAWAMPSGNTFTIPPIKEFVEREVNYYILQASIMNYTCIREKKTKKPVSFVQEGGKIYLVYSTFDTVQTWEGDEQPKKLLSQLGLENEYYADSFSLAEREAMRMQVGTDESANEP